MYSIDSVNAECGGVGKENRYIYVYYVHLRKSYYFYTSG